MTKLRKLLIVLTYALAFALGIAGGYFWRTTLLQACRDDKRWTAAQLFECVVERNNLKLDRVEERVK